MILGFLKSHDFITMINEVPYAAYQSGSGDSILSIDREGTRENLSDLPEAQKTWLVDALDHFFQSQKGKQSVLRILTKPRHFYKIQYPNLSFSEALKKDAMEFQRVANRLLNGPQSSLVKMIPDLSHSISDPIIKTAIDGKSLTSSEVSRLMEILWKGPLYFDLFTPKDQGGQSILPEEHSKERLSDFFQRKGFDERFRQYQVDLMRPRKVQAAREAAFQSCYTNYTFQMSTLPSKAQLAKVEKNGVWAKDKSKKVLSDFLSKQTQGSVAQVIDSSFLAYPMNRENFHRHFMSRINDAANLSAAA